MTTRYPGTMYTPNGIQLYTVFIYIYVIYTLNICKCKKKPCAYKIIHGTHATQTTGLTKSPIDPMDTTSKSFPKSPYMNNIMHNKNHNDHNDYNNCQFSLEPCTPCLFTHRWSPYRASRARLPPNHGDDRHEGMQLPQINSSNESKGYNFSVSTNEDIVIV